MTQKLPRLENSGSSIASGSVLSERFLEMESPTKNVLQKKCRALSIRNEHLKKRLRAKKQLLARLQQKKLFATNSILKNLLIEKSNFVKVFINMQLNHGRRRKWSKSQRQLSLSLYYKSPTAYTFLLYSMKCSLPSIRTIQSWLKVIYLRTGCHNNLSSKLAIKVHTMEEKEKICVLMFDEIALKKQLEFNEAQDFIEGYQDLASLGRTTKFANSALVFYIRGLLYSWKTPFCYYVSAGPVKSDLLKIIIIEVIKKLRHLTLNPLALVCDQASNNRRALSLLGATKVQPIINIDGHKVCTLFDVPHLLKSHRNNFMNEKLQYIVNDNAVAWRDITETYEIDQKSGTTRTMPKITSIHVAPTTFQKMRVKYAAQIFSHTVASAIKTAAVSGQLNSRTSISTAEFIDKVNDIFDALNSRMLKDPNTKRRPLSIYDTNTELTLRNALTFFSSIKVFENQRKRENMYYLSGFEWTIRSILLLWDDLKALGVKFLLTGFLNQDPVENFFSVVRNRGGYNPTPTVRQFRTATQKNINIRLQKSINSSNCEDEGGDVLDMDDIQGEQEIAESELTPPSTVSYCDLEENQSNNEEMLEEEGAPSDEGEKLPTLEVCSNVYVAGYLANVVEKKFKCKCCAEKFTKADTECISKKEMFLLHKDYSRGHNVQFLKRPSEEFSKIISHLLQAFNKSFMKHKCGMRLSEHIATDLNKELERKSDWYSSDNLCGSHYKHIVYVFIKMNLFRHLKWESEKHPNARSSSDCKPHRKIKILS